MSRQARTLYDMCLRHETVNHRDYSKACGQRSKITLGDLESLLEDYYADFREPLAEILPGASYKDWVIKSHIFKSDSPA